MAPQSNFPISQQFAKTLGNAMRIDFVDLLRTTYQAAIKASGDDATTEAKAMALAMDSYTKGGGGSRALQSANQRIVDAMREGVLAAYDSTVRQGGNAFRNNDKGKNRRYGGGALRRALEHPDMFIASYSGISFINATVLDREARQWARLNWGAVPLQGHEGSMPGRPAAQPFSLQLFGESLGAVRPYGKPSAAFGIPPGIWVGAERQRAKGGTTTSTMRWGNRPPGFYPRAKDPKSPTAGITARNFFAPAYEALRVQFPIQYENLVREFADQALRTRKGLLKNYTLEAQAISRYVR